LRIAFLGTPEFAVPPLDALARAGHELACVVAQPDRPAGRGHALREPATKTWARERAVPVLQPEKVRDGRLASDLRALRPDLLVVVAYGRILGDDLLTLAPHGALNVHASLLPRWRGAAPIQWALASGDAETGVTIMQVEAGLDTGDILLQRVLPIGEVDDAESLSRALSRLGAAALVDTLELLAADRLVPVRQDPSRVTVARIIEKEDGRLDFSRPAPQLAARVRAFTPWPGAFTTLRGKLLKVHRARAVAVPGGAGAAPGEPLPSPHWDVACGGGTALRLLEVQLEGKRRMSAEEARRGLGPAAAALGT
jgi:methionyl-tRNA formyltransferase